MSHWIIDLLDLLENMNLFSNKTALCVAGKDNSSAVFLFETISIGKIEQKQTMLTILCPNCNNFNFLFKELLYKINIILIIEQIFGK